jgi:hypothetical protein
MSASNEAIITLLPIITKERIKVGLPKGKNKVTQKDRRRKENWKRKKKQRTKRICKQCY